MRGTRYAVKNRKKKRNSRKLLTAAVIILLAAAAAFIWQSISKDSKKDPDGNYITITMALPEEDFSQTVSETDSPESSEPEPESGSEPEQDTAYNEWVFSGDEIFEPVPRSEKAPDDYFYDAVFVGDSITTGIEIYNILPGAKVLAHTGINIDTILYKQVIKTADGNITIPKALEQYDAGKIYIMMGSNGIAWLDIKTFISKYSAFIDLVKDMHKDSIIYIQSIPPVTASKAAADPAYSNKKIDDYNIALSRLAAEKNVLYLDIASALKNENGARPEEASPTDGMHFLPAYYQKWFDYLKTHVYMPE